MMSAAASITSQSGESCASHTPTGDRHAPPRPAAMPSAGMQVLPFTCEIAPEMDVGMMANSEVAVLMVALIPNARRKIGTMTVPPPIPRRPEAIPISTPTRAGTTK